LRFHPPGVVTAQDGGNSARVKNTPRNQCTRLIREGLDDYKLARHALQSYMTLSSA
jgi:hypothetical protein